MATGRSPGNRRRRRRARGGAFARLAAAAPLRWGFWCIALALGIGAGCETAHLDRIVRARFDGRLFRVPSKVLSAPAVLYSGLDWQVADLKGTLDRLGYRELPGTEPIPPGRYRLESGKLKLHRRAFAHPSEAEPAVQVEITLAGAKIAAIRDADGRDRGVLSLDPETVGAYYGPDRSQRELVGVDDLPPHVVGAILAVEDQRFFEHTGVDVFRIFGALFANLRSGRVIQGGSTLTQQLVKNFFLTPERSLTRKVQEAWMSLIVEARYDKKAILEAYLNEIYLGQRGSVQIHGVGEAAHLYFGKDARDLSPAEAALLAATINNPNGRSPFRKPERALERRNLVLDMMQETGHLDVAAATAAKGEPLGLAPYTPEPREARFFLEFLRKQLPEFYDAEKLTDQGMRIYSTLDLHLQLIAARAVREGLAQLEKDFPKLTKEKQRLEACLVAIRPQTGEVVALVGGRDFGTSQFDRCSQARRPVGSAFKPFVYAAALEPVVEGPTITLATWLDDSPLSVSTPSGPWRPVNYDKEFHGRVRPREALARSLNVATARLGLAVGPKRIADVAHRLGIESELPVVPALALGAADVAPIELALAYATLANGGTRPAVRAFDDVVDAAGVRLERQAVRAKRVLDPGTAFLVTQLLTGVVDEGTGRAIRAAGITGPVAGKTGTTNDEYDTWFAGYTPDLAVVVWVGFDQPKSIGLAAARVALPLWVRFLQEASGGAVPGSFVPPPEVDLVDIDPESGARALLGCARRDPVWFVRGTEPDETCPGFRIAWPSFGRDDDEDGDAPEAGSPPEESRPGGERRRGFFRRLFGPD
jgi:penicillin-binding protein 1B